MLARTNVEIDVDLLDEARALTSLKSKKEIIRCALEELIKQRRRAKLLALRHEGLWQGNLEESRGNRLDPH